MRTGGSYRIDRNGERVLVARTMPHPDGDRPRAPDGTALRDVAAAERDARAEPALAAATAAEQPAAPIPFAPRDEKPARRRPEATEE